MPQMYKNRSRLFSLSQEHKSGGIRLDMPGGKNTWTVCAMM